MTDKFVNVFTGRERERETLVYTLKKFNDLKTRPSREKERERKLLFIQTLRDE